MKSWLNKNIVGFSLASFFNDFCHEMTTAILPAYIESICGSCAPLALGIIEGVSDAASTGAKLFSGWLSDAAQYYKPYLIAGYGLTGIFIALIGTTQSIALITLYKTIAWISRGFREPMRDTWISKIVSHSFYGHAFGFVRALDTLGSVVGPICALILLKLNSSLSSIFFIAIIPGIISVIPIMILTSESKEETNKSRNILFLRQLQVLPKNFKIFAAIMFLFGLGNFNQTLLIYRAQSVLKSADSSMNALLFAIGLYAFSSFIRGLSEFGMGSLSDYIDRKKLLAVFGLGFFGLVYLGFLLNSTQLWIWLLLFACSGFAAGTVKALEKAYAADLLPEHVRGTGMGVLQTLDGIGDLISSFLVGLLWTNVSLSLAFGYAASLSFIAMILLLIAKKLP